MDLLEEFEELPLLVVAFPLDDPLERSCDPELPRAIFVGVVDHLEELQTRREESVVIR